jgi:hypothetical protein
MEIETPTYLTCVGCRTLEGMHLMGIREGPMLVISRFLIGAAGGISVPDDEVSSRMSKKYGGMGFQRD